MVPWRWVEIVPLLRLPLCAVSSVVCCHPSVRLPLCYPRLDFACALSGVSGNRIGCGLLAFSARRCFVFLGCGFALSVWRAGVFAWVLPVFSMVGGAAGMPLAGFLRFSDTPTEPFVRNGFRVFLWVWVAWWRVVVYVCLLLLSTAALLREDGAACWCGGGLRTQERICTTSFTSQ